MTALKKSTRVTPHLSRSNTAIFPGPLPGGQGLDSQYAAEWGKSKNYPSPWAATGRPSMKERWQLVVRHGLSQAEYLLTPWDAYPLPRMEESPMVLGQAQYFSMFDLVNGY